MRTQAITDTIISRIVAIANPISIILWMTIKGYLDYRKGRMGRYSA